jgi:hypothetical protein
MKKSLETFGALTYADESNIKCCGNFSGDSEREHEHEFRGVEKAESNGIIYP